MELNFEQDVRINPNALDVEWLRQAALYQRYAAEAARARDIRDRAKERVDVVMAEMNHAIRNDPAQYGLGEKPTKDAVEAAVLQSRPYTQANDNFLQRKLEAELVQAAVIALDQKKSSLENLVKLMIAGYFAAPKEPRNLAEEWARLEETRGAQAAETSGGVRESLNRDRQEEPPADKESETVDPVPVQGSSRRNR